VVGAGIAGAACAAALRAAGVAVDLLERGRAPGGRMAAPTVHGRRVDLGAAYLTVRDPGFTAVVESWRAGGLIRPWTETFDVLGDSDRTSAGGTRRWAAPDGLRALVRDLLGDLDEPSRLVHAVTDLDDLDHDAVVLAMPDPQAARLVGPAVEWVGYEPVISVVAGWSERAWTVRDAAFVNGDPDLSFIADDGARRGDDAPVLVLHTTAQRAGQHLDDPGAAVAPTLAAARRLLGIDAEPEWTHAHRWTFAKPTGTHGDAPFGLIDVAGRPVGLCTDSWCPEGSPRVESAWLSGTRLGVELARRLG
jgi:renalase